MISIQEAVNEGPLADKKKLYPQPKRITRTAGTVEFLGEPHLSVRTLSGDSEAYTLTLYPGGITIESETPCGAFRAQSTLNQLRCIYGDRLPCMKIEDEPDFSKRGVLLDISRCKVPTMETLFGFIDLLADVKYNQLYLYVEHTFAYRGCETVWRDASPLTAIEIRALDDYCAERFIELVPVQNSLGHMERWLMHPEYKHLAECPDGFYYEPFKRHYEHGTTLAPIEESLDFLDGLYSEYLPNFRGRNFMVGCDEPWELGLGRSKERVEREGFAEVYVDWLRKLNALAGKYGRRMLYFADMIQSHPDGISQLPADASPVIWGYYPGRMPEEDCAHIAAAVQDFYIAPGVNCWLSFFGRLNYVEHNTREAAVLGKKYGARGYINTSWGDSGNHYAWSSMYPGILLGATEAWNAGSGSLEGLAEALDRFVFAGQSSGLGRILLDLASADHVYQIDGWPAGFPHHLAFRGFFNNSDQMKQYFDGKVTLQDVLRTRARFASLRAAMDAILPATREGLVSLQEMAIAADMALLGLERAEYYFLGVPLDDLRLCYEHIIRKYEEAWLLRARPGGLRESVEYIRTIAGA